MMTRRAATAANTVVQVVGGSVPGYLGVEMIRRTRLIASAFTAFALSLSLAEAVLASTCAPDLDAATQRIAHPTSSPAMPCCGPDGQDQDGDRDAAPCPFGPAVGAYGCATAASLPAHTLDDLASLLESAMVVVFDDTQHDLSFANALFHPPKP